MVMIDKVFFDITQYCNGECKYCFTNSVKLSQKYNKELTNDEIIDVLNDLYKIGIEKISIGGGEPFLKNIEEIIEKINKEIKVSITSNGTILSKKFLEQFKLNKNIKLTISLDSLSNEKSNLIRKNININKVIENIKEICKEEETRKRLSIRTTVSQINYKDIYEIIEFCEKNKISNLKINSTNAFGRAKDNRDVILPFEDFMNLLEELVEYCNNNVKSVNVELPVEKYLKGITRKCMCGTSSLYINWNGNVYPCAFSEGNLLLGNVKTNSIKEIINKISNFSHENDFCIQCPINRYKDYERKTVELVN